jgi:hypothetical protein
VTADDAGGTAGKEQEAARAGGPAAGPAEEPLPPNQMLPKEQQFGYMLAVLVLGVVAAIGGRNVVDGKTAFILLTLLGVAAAAAIALTARTGRRILSAIVAMVAGLALIPFGIVEFACLLYGVYLMFRHSQALKKYNQAHPRGARKPSQQAGQPSGRRGRDRAPQPGKGPPASRRYTPPKAKTNRRGR